MATEQITLTPEKWTNLNSSYIQQSWKDYRGPTQFNAFRYFAFRFYSEDQTGTLSNLRINYSFQSSNYFTGNIYFACGMPSVPSSSKWEQIGSYVVEGGGDRESGTVTYNQQITRADTPWFFVIFDSNHINYSEHAYIDITSIDATWTKPDKPNLTIEKIEPTTVNGNGKAQIYLGYTLNESIKVELTGKGEKLDGYLWESTSGSAVSENDVPYNIYNDLNGHYIGITAQNQWFATAGETGNSLTVTVSASSITDPSRKAATSKTFKVNRAQLDVTPTYPVESSTESTIKFRFNNRNNKTVYLTITDVDGNKLVERTNITNKISSEIYTGKYSTNEWFENVEGEQMSVNVLLEDSDGRTFVDKFTLKAGSGVKPKLKNCTVSNKYLSQYSSILKNAHYTKYVVNYSQVHIHAEVEDTLEVGIEQVEAKFNDEDVVLTNTSGNIYEGTTKKTISSTSGVTITITVIDKKNRTAKDTVVIQSTDIQALPALNLRQGTAQYMGDQLTIEPEGYVGGYKFKVTTNGSTLYDYTEYYWSGAYTTDTDYTVYFKNTNQAGATYINLQVYVIDMLDRSLQGGYTTYTFFAPKPIVNSFTCTHIPNSKMPDSGSPSKSDIVAGYSKFTFTVNVKWFCTPDSVTVKSSANDTYTLTQTGDFSPNSKSWPRTANYEFTMTDPIKPNYTTIKYTPTAKDSGTTTGSYSRNGETKATDKEKTFTIFNLKNLTISPSQQNVNAGDNAAFTVSNFVASYDYEFKAANVTKALASGKSKTTAQFTQECQASWFDTATGTTLSVTVNIKDALGRTATATVSIKLLQLVIQSITGSPFTLGSSTPITIKVEGTSGRAVTLTFTTPSKLSKSATIPAGSTSKDITPDKSWFDNDAKKSSITVTVTADNGSQYHPTKTFDVQFPELTLTVDRTSVYVGASFETLDNTIKYTVDNRYSETITLGFEYQQKAIKNTSYTFSADSYSLATPQFFDIIGSSVDALQKISVVPVAKDARGRVARAEAIEIKADSSLGLIFDQYAFEPINPNGIDPQFANRIISDISRLRIKFHLTRVSLSPIDKVYAVRLWNAETGAWTERYLMSSIGDGWYQFETTEPIHIDGETSPDHPGAILFRTEWNCKANDKRGLGIFMNPRTISTSYMYYHVPITNVTYRRCIKDGNSYIPDDSGEYCQVSCEYDFEGFWTQYSIYYKAVTKISFQRCRLEGDIDNPQYIPDSSGEYYEIASSYESEPVVFHIPIEEISFQRCSLSGNTYIPDESGKYYEIICAGLPYRLLEDAVEKTAVTAKNQGTINVQSTGYNQSFSPNFDQLQTTKGTHVFIISNRSMEHSYDITVTVSDLITSVPYTFYLSTAGVIMDFTNTSTGAGIGLGKVAEHGKMVEVSPDWTFQAANINVQVNGSMADLGTLLQQIKTKIGL